MAPLVSVTVPEIVWAEAENGTNSTNSNSGVPNRVQQVMVNVSI
jgi:hypothetical protein